MLTISKDFGVQPFAHRQPTHPGHCRFVHGHDWRLVIKFGCVELDEQGFVVDFGNLGTIKELWAQFDHALVLQRDDPELATFQLLEADDLVDLRLLDSVTCEGIARYLYGVTHEAILELTNGRAHVVAVTLYEGSKNSATWEPT